MGLPTSKDFAEALGVTPEDHERWEKNRMRKQMEKANNPGKQMLNKTVKDLVHPIEMGLRSKMQSQMQGQMDRENRQQEITETRSYTRTRYADEPEVPESALSDGPEMGGF